MSKLDVSRHDGERLDAYIGRLEGMAGKGMAAEDRNALIVSLAAAKALFRQQQTPKPARPSDHGNTYRPPSDAGERLSPTLDYCKALYRALSPQKQTATATVDAGRYARLEEYRGGGMVCREIRQRLCDGSL